jgi:hypothetical protein
MNVLMAGWNRTTVVHPAVIYSSARLNIISSHMLPPIGIFPLFFLWIRSRSFFIFILVLVKSFHPSQHDIRRYIKAWGGYFFLVGCCCCWSGGNVSIESEENGPTQWSRGEQRSLWFQRTNETPLSVLTQQNEDAIIPGGSNVCRWPRLRRHLFSVLEPGSINWHTMKFLFKLYSSWAKLSVAPPPSAAVWSVLSLSDLTGRRKVANSACPVLLKFNVVDVK